MPFRPTYRNFSFSLLGRTIHVSKYGINFYPSLALLGKSGEDAPVWHYFSLLVAVVLLVVAGIVWTRGVKRYAGAGG